jgi:Domain of unknown function (DUF4349)
MKTKSLVFLALTMAALLFACSQRNEKRQSALESAETDSTANLFISSSAAVANAKDSTRKFIRTADIKFKVKSVVAATQAIENITNQNGGFVIYTNLNSTVDHKSVVAVSADSSLESTYFTVVNALSLRVPNILLDTTLKSIAAQIDYLDYRVIKADDVALQMLSNTMTQNRHSKNEQRLTRAIDNRGKKLNETARAEELLMNTQEESDHSKITNLALQDKVSFSTVVLSIYQRQAVKRELVSNDKNIDAYTPGFGQRIQEALKSGWEILENILVLLAHLWALILFTVALYILYRKYKIKLKKSSVV